MDYVKNITAHYRLLLDEILARRPELARASSGECHISFTPTRTKPFIAAAPVLCHRPQGDIGAGFAKIRRPAAGRGQPVHATALSWCARIR